MIVGSRNGGGRATSADERGKHERETRSNPLSMHEGQS